MNIIKFAIYRKVFISMLFIGLTMLGYISYKNLPVELLPNTELPILWVFVQCRQEMDPEYVEREAIIPLEGAIGTLEGIEEIESSAQQRRGTIAIYYAQDTRMKYAYLKLQERINEIKSSLPEEFQVHVFRIDTEQLGSEFMKLQVRGSGGQDRIRNIADSKIVRALESIDGIASVEVFGGRRKAVEIILDNEACRAYGITPVQVRYLIERNGQSDTYVGQVGDRNKSYFVSLITEYKDIHELENIVVRRDGPVLLKDLAEVYTGVMEETSLSRVNGKEAVTIELSRDSQVNLIELSHATSSVIEKLNSDLSSMDAEIVIESNTAKNMERNINLIIHLALLGGLLAVAILWMFLGNLRTVLIVALAIPISVFSAFNFFYAFGISINSLTLIGLALVVGMLLDNSIVVLENIHRLISKGKDTLTAVTQGTGEVWRAIFAATLTTITVFVPFMFSSTFLVKLIGRHIAVSIISTLSVSLVVALLFVPMATHFLLKRGYDGGANFRNIPGKNRLIGIYTLLLKSSLRFPARTVIGSIVLFFASIMIAIMLSLNVSKEVESGEFNLYVTMPKGSTLESTDAAVADLENRTAEIEEKQDIISNINEDSAVITIRLREDYPKIGNRSMADIKEDIEKRIEDFRTAEVSFEPPLSSQRSRGRGGADPGTRMQRMFGIGTQEESITVKGNDFQRMRDFAEDLRYYLENLSSVSTVRLNIMDNSPEIHLLFDKQLISGYGISLGGIAAELGTFQMDYSSTLKYKQGGEEYDIVIRESDWTADEDEKNIEDLKQLPISGQDGGVHELQEISRIIYSYGMSGIRRVNQEKQIEIRYQFISEVNSSKALLDASRAEIDELVAGLKIPSSMAVEVIHEETQLGEYLFLFLIAFVLIYMILASVFESLVTPIVMMFTIPLAAIGSFWALIFTGTSLTNTYTLTGFLILLGVVVNNGIILIDYTRILRQRGYRRPRALIMAGQARIRPILITALTTIVGMLPLAMGKLEQAAIMGAPFAITVIGGLSLSTLFTLVLIPVVYSGLETALEWIKRLDWKIRLIHLVLFVVGCYLLYLRVESLIWRIAGLLSLILSIPGITYLLMTSLRRAQAEYIKPDEPITIEIRNLVKIYDRDTRFVREWKKGRRIHEKVSMLESYSRWRDFDQFIWQLPLLGFLVYFVYFYIRSPFWLFVLPHTVYFYVFFLWKPIRTLLEHRANSSGDARYGTLIRYMRFSFVWGFPLLNLILFYLRWNNPASVPFIGLVWYLALIIYTTSSRLHRDRINIDRLSGRFSGLRRRFYGFVQLIPVIGKRKRPFKALDRVSLEIGHGMFGLLGPNGAGKTTLMRIICGILEQSYGKIRLNGIDANENREELQGLIGYLPQEFGTYERMTAYEFLDYQALLKNVLDKEKREKIVNYALSAVHIEKYKDRRIGTFSGGMKQRIGIAQTLLHLPRILVVDEPTAGLDPRERIRFRNLLVELSRERIVIFSTHIIEDISSSCNTVAVLNEGKLHYLGKPSMMAATAEGYVWQFHIPAGKFESIMNKLVIVHHMRDGERIRVRCLAEKKPFEGAQTVRPTLEDAYIWLIGKREGTRSINSLARQKEGNLLEEKD